MKRIRSVPRVEVNANGKGVVSHAGVGLLREMAEHTGLTGGITAALLDTYKGLPVHAPGRVFCDLAVAVADSADAISGIAVLGDGRSCMARSPRCPPPGGYSTASMPTTWSRWPRLGPPRGSERGRPEPHPISARNCVWTSTPRSHRA